MKRRNFNTLLSAIALALSVAAPAYAAWPDGKTISIVVPYAPGGTADALARLIAQHLGPKLGTSVVVVNKAGASGVIGAQAVAQASPDGFTVLYDATPFSINPHLQKLPYDAEKDLIPVTQVGVTPMLMTVPKASPFATAADLIKAGKAAPGKLNFASGGQGTVQYMAPELMNQAAGVNMLHIPYKSGGLAITGTIAGEVDMGFFNLPAISGHVKSGTVKALAITSGGMPLPSSATLMAMCRSPARSTVMQMLPLSRTPLCSVSATACAALTTRLRITWPIMSRMQYSAGRSSAQPHDVKAALRLREPSLSRRSARLPHL